MPHSHQGVISAAGTPSSEPTSVKDTLISVLISLVLAFVFRGFVVEAFQIPTGSMAPTLLGAHMRFRSPVTGAEWTVSPWEYLDSAWEHPKPEQRMGPDQMPLVVHDPMSNYEIQPRTMPALAGDRIFVLKYLYSIFDPSRFDVVVFKNPLNPQENYIKRLIGLPNEQIALVDGDVFHRPMSAASDSKENPWAQPGWQIARKPERVQRAVWQPVFESQFTPRDSKENGSQWFFPPWKPSGGGWEIENRPSYRYNAKDATRLSWDADKWPLADRYAYNESFLKAKSSANSAPSVILLNQWKPSYWYLGPRYYFPVSDVRLTAGIQPDEDGLECTLNIIARGHDFRASLGQGKAVLEMRPHPASDDADGPWTRLGAADISGLFAKGRISNVELWHADQALQLWIDGRLALTGEYDWSPAQRIQYATGLSLEDATKKGILTDGTKYRTAAVDMTFKGSPVTLYRVGMWRDLHYQATDKADGIPDHMGLATAPNSVLTTGPDHFFCCGDNSPSSFDGRMWGTVEPWVADQIDSTTGIVHRNLLIGKAFFVYFPAMETSRKIPIPDVGRMRLIW